MGKKRIKKKTRVRIRNRRIGLFACFLAAVLLICAHGLLRSAKNRGMLAADPGGKPPITEAFLTPNPYSRPQKKLGSVNGIVVHYTANPGSGALANRNYFEGLKDSKETKASSHFIIGIDGEILQCIPLSEVSYASNNRNRDTISIECCHKEKDGQFSSATYASLVQLTGWLCNRFGLDTDQVIRHYDVTGKICPKYFVEHPDAWKQFLNDVSEKRLQVHT